MRDVVKQALLDLVRQYGTAIGHDPRRCEGLLKDVCGPYRREIRILTEAVREGVPDQLAAAIKSGEPLSLVIGRLAQHLYDLGNQLEPARWAVEVWVAALTGRGAPDSSSARATRRAAGRELRVRRTNAGAGEYLSINSALAAAQDGDRIVVSAGIYRESLVILKAIEIVADGLVTIQSNSSSSVFSRATGAALRGCKLRSEAGDLFSIHVISGNLVVEDCDVSSAGRGCIGVHGIDVKPSIRRCKIHDGAGFGVFVYDGASSEIEDCEIFNNVLAGISVAGGARPNVRRCRIYGGKVQGVLVTENSSGLFLGCEIFANHDSGVCIMNDANPIFRKCMICWGNLVGVEVLDKGCGVLEDCEVHGNLLKDFDISANASTKLRATTGA